MDKRVFPIEGDNAMLHYRFNPPHRVQSRFQNEFRVVLVVSGMSRYYTPYGSLQLKSGDVLLFHSDNFVNTWKNDIEDCEVIVMKMTQSYLNGICKFKKKRTLVEEFIPFIKVDNSYILNQYMSSMKGYLNIPELLTPEFLTLKVEELFHILWRYNGVPSYMHQIETGTGQEDSYLQEIVSRHLFTPIHVEELAFLCHMSLSTFQRRFKSLYPCSPAKHIEQKRMERAIELLKDTRMTISEICEAIGFTSLSHFSNVFKKYYKAAPSRYRLKHME